VPFFVVDRTYGVSGAQPVEVLLQVLEQRWAERGPRPSCDGGRAPPPGCDDTSCAV
jgi:predicted DsbA family dithiol-disulfide isomerase